MLISNLHMMLKINDYKLRCQLIALTCEMPHLIPCRKVPYSLHTSERGEKHVMRI
jgi:hypothetical protein